MIIVFPFSVCVRIGHPAPSVYIGHPVSPPAEAAGYGLLLFFFFHAGLFYHTHRKSLPPKTIASVTRPQISAQSHAATAEAGM